MASLRLPTDLAPLPGSLQGSAYALLNVIGSGAAFPFSFSGAGGTSSVNIASGMAKINMSIHMILSTRKGERVMRPTFGCFTGDTLVPLLSGEVVPISSLVGRRVDLYGCDLKGVITATESPGAVSRGVRKVVAVALDNGSVIRCTPDHLFLCRDGVYREASSLTEGTSLMPLYRHITKKGYEMAYIPSLNRRVKWYTSEEGLAHVTALGKSHRKNVDADEILSFAQTVSVSSRGALYQAVEQHFGVSRGLIKSRVKLSDLGRVGPNHKVSFVSFAGEEEVFDLVDSTTGNYALDAGVFVHNSDVAKLLFNPNDQATWNRLKFEVADALTAWEKRIQITQVTAISGLALSPTLLQSIPGLTQQVATDLQSPNAMGIVIQYIVLRTNVPGSYVYPYSINGDPLTDNLSLRFAG